MIKKWFLVLALMSALGQAQAQEHPLGDTSNKVYTRKLSESYPVHNELFLEKLKSLAADKKVLKHYESTYKNIFKALNEVINEGQMVYHPVISPMLEKVLKRLKERNPDVPADIQLMLLRENVPNAYTVGDNTLFVNLGLLYYLRSEDQVAAILAHEISHLVLQHSIKSLTYNYKKDKENVANVKAIRHTDVNKADRALDAFRKSLYKEGKIERKYEMQADSMGYVLTKNAGYSKTALLEALEIIDQNDTIDYGDLAIESYMRFFDLPTQKFDDKWLAMEDFTSYNYKDYTPKFNEDSVSSHPKVADRIQYLAKVFPELENRNSTSADKGFTPIIVAAQNERLINLYFNERYGEAVYLSLLGLQEDPADSLGKRLLGISMQKLYQARKDYQLNKFLDRVTPGEQSESYIRFLNFMWNLKLEELKNISDYYTPKA